MKRSKWNKKKNQLHYLGLPKETDILNPINLFSQLTSSADEVPYLECSTTFFTTYDLKAQSDARWNQVMINPYKLPGFTDISQQFRADLCPILESLDVSVMPKFSFSTGGSDDSIVQMTGNQVMFMAGVPARASGMGKRKDGKDTYDDGLFQPHRRLIEPSSDLTYKHSAHFNYLQLQRNQQQLIQIKTGAGEIPALILCSIAIVNPIDGGSILNNTTVTINLMVKLRYSVPIWMKGIMQTQYKETDDPTSESAVSSFRNHVCYPEVHKVKHVN